MMRVVTTILAVLVAACFLNSAQAADAGVRVTFSDAEVQTISAWYREQTDSNKGNKGKKGKGHQNSLPPGIEKNLARGKSLPPGIAKQYLPADLRHSLPAAPDGYERIIAGGKVLLVEVATQIIHDVLTDIIVE